MIEFAVFHNGGSDLQPKRGKGGYWYNEGTLEEIHESPRREIGSQVRQAVLAEELGYDYWFQTEHHFQVEGAERNSSGLMVEAAIAALTSKIRLGQMANILPWWHPIRLAEYVATLDVISGGRVEFGVGRGYSPRESEVFGQLLNSTIQDQEKNRSWYEEALELIITAWTQESFSFHGEFFSIPPSWTKWGHPQSEALFDDSNIDRDISQVVRLGRPEGAGPPVMATTTTLKEISVFPRPVQKPYPQMWTPVTSDRSVRFAAKTGMNAFFSAERNIDLKKKLVVYYEEAEANGWADRTGAGPFKFGWDSSRRRGVVPCRMIHITDKGVGDSRRAEEAANLMWSYHAGFGGDNVLRDAEGDLPEPGNYYPGLLNSGIALHGSTEQVIDGIMTIKDECGYDNDFLISVWFEAHGFTSEEVETQMSHFAENIKPVLEKECNSNKTDATV